MKRAHIRMVWNSGGFLCCTALLLNACGSDQESVPVGQVRQCTFSEGRHQAALGDLRKLLAQVPEPQSTAAQTGQQAGQQAKADPRAEFSAQLQERLQRPITAFGKHGTIAAFFSPKTPITVPGVGKSTDFLEVAEKFLQEYPGLLHLDEQDALVQATVASNAQNGATVRFRQTHAGIPCHGSYVALIMDSDRSVRGFFSSTLPVTASAQPAIDQAAATALAADVNETALGAGELRYVDREKDEEPRLVWVVPLQTAQGPADAWVDAQTGQRLERQGKVDKATHDMTLFDTGADLLGRQTTRVVTRS